MGLTTPRYALRYPVAADANNVPTDMLNLATDLDNKMASFISGLLSARPAASLSGRFYYATDTKELFYDTGAAWRSLTGQPTIPVLRWFLSSTPASGTVLAVVAWNNTTFNRNGMPTATTKFIAPVTGYYKLRAQLRWNIGGAANGATVIQIRKGPNSDTAGTVIAQSHRSANWTLAFDNDIANSVETRVQLNGGDDCAVWHGATPASVLYGSTDQSFFEAELVTVT